MFVFADHGENSENEGFLCVIQCSLLNFYSLIGTLGCREAGVLNILDYFHF